MKKMISVMMAAALLMSSGGAAVNAAALETAPEYEKKTVETNVDDLKWDCLFRSDLPEIPFVNADDYLARIYNMDKAKSEHSGGVYKYEKGSYSMTLNADKDTVSFDFYEGFLFNDMKNGFNVNNASYIQNADGLGFIGGGMEFVDDVKGLELDLSKYDLDIVEKDGSVYLPFCTLNDIFSYTSFTVTFKKDKLTLMDSDMMGAKGSFKEKRSKEYAKFTYDEFCFSEDSFHGKPSNARITESVAKIGLDKTLDTYNSVTPKIKELLLSESTEDYCTGVELLQFYLDDGGHTILDYSMSDRLKKYGISNAADAARKVYGDNVCDDAAEIIASEKEAAERVASNNAAVDQKSKAYKGFEAVKQWQGAGLYRSGDTYFFDFSGFVDYVVEPFKWSMDYVQEHGGKYFIIDTTGGGNTAIAVYMTSLINGEVKYAENYIASNNLTRFTGRVDKNLDGKFDEKDDAVKYDFRCAVLTHKMAYSCANIWACMANDNGICVIGENTAGGSCCATARLYPNGTAYNVSGYTMYTPEGGKDPDKGAVPDVVVKGAENNYEGFYDVNTLTKGIAEFYGDPIPQQKGVYGDMDSDGEVSSADALFVLRMSVGIEEQTAENKTLADVNGDGEVNAGDALSILRFSVGLGEADSKINTAVTA